MLSMDDSSQVTGMSKTKKKQRATMSNLHDKSDVRSGSYENMISDADGITSVQ